jgi:hypothetical protein
MKTSRRLHSPRLIIIIASALLMLLATVRSNAQTDDLSADTPSEDPVAEASSGPLFLVGVTGGVTRNSHSGGFRMIDDPLCPNFEDGKGVGYLVGISANYRISDASVWGVVARVGLEQRPGNFHEVLPNAKVLIPNPDGSGDPEVTTQSTSMTAEIHYPLLGSELLLQFLPLRVGQFELGLVAGPSLQFVLNGANRRTYQEIDSPDDGRFINSSGLPTENGGRRLIFEDGDIPARNSVRWSAKAGVQGVWTMTSFLRMAAGISYDHALTDVTSTEPWTVNSIIGQVDVLVEL